MGAADRVEYFIAAKDRTGPGTKSAKKNIGGTEKAALSAAKAFVGLAAAGAALHKVMAATKAFADYADRMDDISKATGVAVDTLSVLNLQAKRNGTDIENVNKGLRRLARNAYDADRGLSTAVEAFDDLGISVHDSNGKLKGTEQLYRETVQALSKMESETKKAALAQVVFGRSGAELLPMINEGADAIERYRQRAEELGITLSERTAKAASVLNDRLDELKLITEQGVIGEGFLTTMAGLSIMATNVAAGIQEIKSNLEKLSGIQIPGWLNTLIRRGASPSPAAFIAGELATHGYREGSDAIDAEIAADRGGYTPTGGIDPLTMAPDRSGYEGRLAAFMEAEKKKKKQASTSTSTSTSTRTTPRSTTPAVTPGPIDYATKNAGYYYPDRAGSKSDAKTDFLNSAQGAAAQLTQTTEQWVGTLVAAQVAITGIQASVSTIGTGIAEQLVEGTYEWRDAWKAVLKQVIATAIEMAVIQAILAAATGGTSAAGTAGGGSILGIIAGGLGGKGKYGGLVTDQGIQRFAVGGLVRPDGYDSVPAFLHPGEVVLRKPTVDRIGRDNALRLNESGSMSGGGNTFNINVTAGDGADGRKIAQQIYDELSRRARLEEKRGNAFGT